MADYKGRKGTYTLGKKISAGGEGTVYHLKNHPGHVAKIFHEGTKDLDHMRRKIETMMTLPIKPVVDNILRVAWPEDILLDGNRFVGYVMPFVTAPYEIFCVYRDDDERDKMFRGKFDWICSVRYAYNLSWVVWYLHMNGIVIGDMNMKNIRINEKGHITVIDCDSFDIVNPKTKEHFKCEVGLEELLAPELQCVGALMNGHFSKESDDFSLAIHIFRLLMKNADPFGAKLISKKKSSNSLVNANAPIIRGECVYVRNVPGKAAPDWVPPFDMLPTDIQDGFRRTFGYTELTAIQNIKRRTTAEEWARMLYKMTGDNNPYLTRCSRNKRHIYPVHNTECPWCGAKKIHDSGLLKKLRNLKGY